MYKSCVKLKNNLLDHSDKLVAPDTGPGIVVMLDAVLFVPLVHFLLLFPQEHKGSRHLLLIDIRETGDVLIMKG